MKKEWFILINDVKEGSFTPRELRRDLRVTLDTWVWKEGFENWVPLRFVPELKRLFKEEDTPEEEDFPFSDLGPYQLVIAAQNAPPPLVIWLIIVAMILMYSIYHLYFVS